MTPTDHTKDGKQRARLRTAIGEASASAKPKAMVPDFVPNAHVPPPTRTPRQQVNAHPARNHKGQFTKTG